MLIKLNYNVAIIIEIRLLSDKKNNISMWRLRI